MNNNTFIILLIAIICSSCTNQTNIDTWKQEIADAEQAFNEMAAEDGIPEAFRHFAADSGVIKRSQQIFKGKEAIFERVASSSEPGDSLTWIPTLIDVSASGDMAYTYGDFTYSYLDTLGVRQYSQGIFHTVWKRQPNGEWKYVWD